MSSGKSIAYVPTLSIRLDEMKALEYLDDQLKDILMPCILLSPWLSSKKLEKSRERIQKSFGTRRHVLDLDRYYEWQGAGQLSEAAADFYSIREEGGAYRQWREYVELTEGAIPCIQLQKLSLEEIGSQVDWAVDLSRGVALRFDFENPAPISHLAEAIRLLKDEHFYFIVDAGWIAAAELAAAKIGGLIRQFVDNLEKATVVISCASFPNDFSDIEGLDSMRITARMVFNIVRAQFNSLELVYGDWASTKPRRYDGRMSKPRTRVDFPTKTNWIFSRNEKGDEDFYTAAQLISRLPEWEERVDSWGNQMIEWTIEIKPFAIDTDQKARAARINTHLHLQATFEQAPMEQLPDAEWVEF